MVWGKSESRSYFGGSVMKENKFRAWDKVPYFDDEEPKREMIYFDLYETRKIENLSLEAVEMQYTGLKDKNGVEIYEGDIVKIVSKVTGLFTKGKVVQGYGCFLVQYDWNTHLLCEFHNIEVIGNIYENPELAGD